MKYAVVGFHMRGTHSRHAWNAVCMASGQKAARFFCACDAAFTDDSTGDIRINFDQENGRRTQVATVAL